MPNMNAGVRPSASRPTQLCTSDQSTKYFTYVGANLHRVLRYVQSFFPRTGVRPRPPALDTDGWRAAEVTLSSAVRPSTPRVQS